MTGPQIGRSTGDKDEARESCRVLLTPQTPHILERPMGNLTNP